MTVTALGLTPAAPLIARVGGVSADRLPAGDLGRRVEELQRLEERLDAARASLVERLHEAIPAASPEHRPLLLAVKRDGYNRRPLARHVAAEGWREVVALAPGAAAEVAELEPAIASWRESFAAAFAAAARAEAAAVVRLLADRRFACGLAIASPVVAAQSSRLSGALPERFGRREKRLVTTLLRYVSRAALKLSPFSTFTAVGLAEVDRARATASGGRPSAVRLAAGAWEDSSLLRLRRYVLDQYWELLCSVPEVREHLRVALNDSWRPSDGERQTFLRPSHWRPLDGSYQYFEEALVRVRIDAGLLAALTAVDGGADEGDRPTWRELAGALGVRLGLAPDEAARQVDRLIEIGFLHLLPAWSTDEPHLEKAMLVALRRHPAAPRLAAFLDSLARLVAREEGLLVSSDPSGDVDEIERLTVELWRQAARLAGLAVEPAEEAQKYRFYQDAFRRPPGGAPSAPLVGVGRAAAEEALGSIEPLARYTRLFDHRLELTATLREALRRRWPGRSEVGLIELFEAVQGHWQEYSSFVVETRGSSRWGATWNPLGLAELDELDSFRRRARESLADCFEDTAEGRRIDGEALDALLDEAPPAARATAGGCCLFVQPATADGSLWVLNRLKEGTGRFASRYTSAMSDEERRRYADEISSRAVIDVDGVPVELLDVQCIQGDTLNVHAPQTPRLLTLPGAASELPAERRLGIRDLVVACGEEGRLELRDRAARRYLPVHLGVGYFDYMPTVVKFLCLFGPSEMGAVFPAPWTRREGDLAIGERTVIGNVVVHRRTWSTGTSELRALIQGVSEVEAGERLNRWRLTRRIHERVFLRESVPHPLTGRRVRPQYLDFSSPGLLRVLRATIESEARLTLVEMLPQPEALPRDAQGRPWAVELLLDSVALSAPRAEGRTDPSIVVPRGVWSRGESEPRSARH